MNKFIEEKHMKIGVFPNGYKKILYLWACFKSPEKGNLVKSCHWFSIYCEGKRAKI